MGAGVARPRQTAVPSSAVFPGDAVPCPRSPCSPRSSRTPKLRSRAKSLKTISWGGISEVSSIQQFQQEQSTQFSHSQADDKVHSVQLCSDFSALYRLGPEVMPSAHPNTSISFATHRDSGMKVVVKTRKKSGRSTNDMVAWLSSYKLMLEQPVCPSIATVFEMWEDRSANYVVMELVAGQDLFEMIRQAPVVIASVKEVLRQILQALDIMHTHGCIHRDVKLENIVCYTDPSASTKGCQAKLLDFDNVEAYTPGSPKMVSEVLGTDQYIAPEAYLGHLSPACDIFSLGVVAYCLMTSKYPFSKTLFTDSPGENWVGSAVMIETHQKIVAARISWRSHSSFMAEASGRKLVQRMMSIDPCRRGTARELLLEPWLQS